MKLISSNIFLKHKLEGHVERPERIKQILKDFPFEKAEKGDIYLHLVHTPEYIDKVKQLSLTAGDEVRYIDAGDTYITKETYNVAVNAVGAVVKAAQYALKGQNAFALVRPPGHHAHPGWTGGFCIFNNVAIGAAYLAQKGKKVLVFDFDIHRGDGTQACVKQLNRHLDGRLFYLSINQEGVFPGASLDEGSVYNLYVPPGTSEAEYIELMQKELLFRIQNFKPDVIALSAGFDGFAKDAEEYNTKLGCGLQLTAKTVQELKKIIGKIPYFAVLEGGYTPEAVTEGVTAFLNGKVKKQKKQKAKPAAKKTAKKATKKKLAKSAKKKTVKKSGKKKTVKKKMTKKKPTKKTTKMKVVKKKTAKTKKKKR